MPKSSEYFEVITNVYFGVTSKLMNNQIVYFIISYSVLFSLTDAVYTCHVSSVV